MAAHKTTYDSPIEPKPAFHTSTAVAADPPVCSCYKTWENRGMQRLHWSSVSAGAVILMLLAGCKSQPTAGSGTGGSTGLGIVYYLDGAGGSGLITNWGRHVHQGLKEAGYLGTFAEYDWETGLGVVADQVSSDAYKRQRAAKVALQIQEYTANHRGSRITLMGLSAGTAVAVFALEQLPAQQRVDTVVLLSSSIASDYDMTEALQHVQGNLYVTTSKRDEILSIAIPMFGTADRQPGAIGVAGLEGFTLPPGASPQTVALYRKIHYLPWTPQYDAEGDFGGHTDTTVPPFIRDTIAPLVMVRTQRNAIAP